jgi:hypothetical protein
LKRLLITQSNYIPWKGYFDAIGMADEVILYDDAKFTKRDWRNRNQIKTPHGNLWLSIPVEVKGKYSQRIRETKISEKRWNEKHWKSIYSNYARASHFKEMKDFVAHLYDHATMQYLSEINFWFLTEICRWLNIHTKFTFSDRFDLEEPNPTQRLVNICKQAGASEYLSGPAAMAYLEEDKFANANLALTYMDYSGYPEYPQLYPPFVHEVSILDLLLNTGTDSHRYMKLKTAHESR